MDARGIDLHDPGRVNRELQRLRREIESLRSERRAGATTIADGDIRLANGGSLVVDGGDVVMLDADGSEMLRIGPQQHGDRGVSVSREDGSLALVVRKAFSNSTLQTLEIRDRLGNLIVSEEALGWGLSRPFLQIPMRPVMATPTALMHGQYGPEVPVTSGTFETTHQAWYARHNQYGRFCFQIAASDATTAAEVRVINVATGNPLAAFFQPSWLGTRAVGDTAFVEVVSPPLSVPGDPDDRISIAAQVRRSAGAGTLTVALPESHGA